VSRPGGPWVRSLRAEAYADYGRDGEVLRPWKRYYRLLCKYGTSQRATAATTSQCQSEISEILKGNRQIGSYQLLPLGLAYDEETAELLENLTRSGANH
jgi:hypothetical protein